MIPLQYINVKLNYLKDSCRLEYVDVKLKCLDDINKSEY